MTQNNCRVHLLSKVAENQYTSGVYKMLLSSCIAANKKTIKTKPYRVQLFASRVVTQNLWHQYLSLLLS